MRAIYVLRQSGWGNIEAATDCARQKGLTTFQQRLAAFQNGNVRSNLEGSFFDDFFGWWNPEAFDGEGNVVEQS